jgi:predicted nucleic acid-binding protein
MEVNDRILVDTSYWIALFDKRDKSHEKALANTEYLLWLDVLIVWPIVYETFRTRFVRHPEWVTRLEEILKQPNFVFMDDAPYRDDALWLTLEFATRDFRPVSMVDMLCRLVISDGSVNVKYLLTTNTADFVDVCLASNVEIL